VDRKLLLSFIAVADELHFGRAAQRLGVLPAIIGREVRRLEEEIGVRLFDRTTRSVMLTPAGEAMLGEARSIVARMDEALGKIREAGHRDAKLLRVGAIDSAATGLMPQLVRDFSAAHPGIDVLLVEDKTIRLLPRLASGSLDIALVRPPPSGWPNIEFTFLLHECVVVALPETSPLTRRHLVTIEELVDVPLIVPSPRQRPHSYQLTQTLFEQIGARPRVAQTADEKHTIVNLVGTGVGAAIVPFWTSRLSVAGVVYRPLTASGGLEIHQLPLSVAHTRGVADGCRDDFIRMLLDNLATYR
jgi:DNA-binding transcriptional LysR family regulator